MSIHRLLFAVLMIVWTWLLLKPNPVPEIVSESLVPDFSFFLSKCVHFGVYAFLAFYGTVRMTPSQRQRIWLFLFLHGIGGEIGQYIGDTYYQTHRHGCIRDVLIDTAGILTGAWLRRWFSSDITR